MANSIVHVVCENNGRFHGCVHLRYIQHSNDDPRKGPYTLYPLSYSFLLGSLSTNQNVYTHVTRWRDADTAEGEKEIMPSLWTGFSLSCLPGLCSANAPNWHTWTPTFQADVTCTGRLQVAPRCYQTFHTRGTSTSHTDVTHNTSTFTRAIEGSRRCNMHDISTAYPQYNKHRITTFNAEVLYTVNQQFTTM